MDIVVPHQSRPLEPPPRERIRALRRHLIGALRDLQRARKPERLIQPPPVAPPDEALSVLRAGCAACQGYCCTAGGDHAFLDERTMARVRRDHPDWTVRTLIAAYVRAVAPRSFAGSCLFHGRRGCTLDPALRASLCASFYCNPLADYLKAEPLPGVVTIRAETQDAERKRAATSPTPSSASA